MSYPGPSPMPRSAPPPPPRNRWVVPCFAACGCVLLVIGIIVAMAFKGVRSGADTIKQSSTSAEQFLTALEKPDTQAAYGLMSEKVQNEKGKASVFDAMEVLEKRYGHPTSHSQTLSFNFNMGNGVSTVSLLYQETFQKSSMPVHITLISEKGQWRVVSFDFRP